MTSVLESDAVRTRVPLWLVVVRRPEATYVEVLTGGGEEPPAVAPADDGQATLRIVRRELSRYLAASRLSVTPELCDDVVLCANEVLTNALVHTASRVITVTADVLPPDARRPVTVQVVVGDEQRRRPPTHGCLADESFETGRGLYILEQLASWGCRRRTHGKEVWFRCAASANPAECA